jgi:hypothetical protein
VPRRNENRFITKLGEEYTLETTTTTTTRVYKTIILPGVLYECETWTVSLREGHKLQISENKMLRKIYGHKNRDI